MNDDSSPILDVDSKPHRKGSTYDVQDPLYHRHLWLDQLRSVIVIFSFIASLTWLFSGNIRGGEIPVGPTWLNFGYRYVDFFPRMITLVDIGSQIFMFIMGLSLSISFQTKAQKKGYKYAWISVFNRVFVFFWLVEVLLMDFIHFYLNDIIILGVWVVLTIIIIVLRNTFFKQSDAALYISLIWSIVSCIIWFFKYDIDLWTVFFNHPLAHFAWATLLGALGIFTIKRPDIRIIIPGILLGIHYYLWERFRYWGIQVFVGTHFEFHFMIPFELMGMGIVGMTATCVWDWIHMDPTDFKVGFKKRFVPLMVLTCIGHFITDFFQTADSEGVTASIILLAVAFSSMLAMTMYAMEYYIKYDIPFLTAIGKNALFLLLLQAVLVIPYRIVWPGGGGDFRSMVQEWFNVSTQTHILVNLMGCIAFLIPIVILIITGWILDKYKIHIKV